MSTLPVPPPKLVEVAETKEFFENALHPYSRVLMAAVPKPVVMDDKDELYRGIGKIAKASREGCPFCSRCAQATERCRGEMPEQREVTEGHFVSCHLYE